MDVWVIIEILLVVGFAYLVGHANGWRAGRDANEDISRPLVAGYSHALNAANYWEDRARLQEQKLNMVVVESTRYVSVESLPKWRAAATTIMQATGEITRG